MFSFSLYSFFAPQGVIRKHAEQYRSGAGEGAGGGHSGVPPYEVGMKRIRDYNDNFMSKRPMGGGEVMEVRLRFFFLCG